MSSISDSMMAKIKKSAQILEQDFILLSLNYAKKALEKILKDNGDVYYTAFAASVIKAFEPNYNFEGLRNFLKEINYESLDLPNFAAFARSAYISKCDLNLKNFSLEKFELNTPYEFFLRLGASQDLSLKFNFSFFKIDEFRAKLGGFSNIKNANFSGANATASALCAKFFSDFYIDEIALNYLLRAQTDEGGFKAQEDSVCPDLLTTASSLFAITELGGSPRVDAKEFVAFHYLEDGSFSASVLDSKGDCEYLFYGLLALGACV